MSDGNYEISNISVSFNADVSQFNKDIDNASKKLDALKNSLTGVDSQVSNTASKIKDSLNPIESQLSEIDSQISSTTNSMASATKQATDEIKKGLGEVKKNLADVVNEITGVTQKTPYSSVIAAQFKYKGKTDTEKKLDEQEKQQQEQVAQSAKDACSKIEDSYNRIFTSVQKVIDEENGIDSPIKSAKESAEVFAEAFKQAEENIRKCEEGMRRVAIYSGTNADGSTSGTQGRYDATSFTANLYKNIAPLSGESAKSAYGVFANAGLTSYNNLPQYQIHSTNQNQKQQGIPLTIKQLDHIKELQKSVNDEVEKEQNDRLKISSILSEVSPMLGSMIGVIEDVCEATAQGLEKVNDALVILMIIRLVIKAIKQTINQIKRVASAVWEFFKGWMQTVWALTSGMAKIYGYIGLIVGKMVGFAILSPITHEIEKIKGFFSTIKQKLNYFGGMVKRVLIYKLLRTLLKEMAEGFTKGLENIYQYALKISNSVTDQLTKDFDSIATDFQYLKNSIASIFAPALQMLAPLLNQVVDAFVELGNKVAQVMATLNGQTSYVKAVRAYKSYADAAEDATEKNNELKKSFAGLDEITVIGQNQNDSSSSSDKNNEDYGAMFETVPIENTYANIGKKIKQLWQDIVDGFNSGDLTEAGTKIANAINNAFKWIDGKVNWNVVGDKVTKTIKTLATGFNALIKEVDWKSIGSTVAGGVNTIINSLYYMLTEFNWVEMFKGFGETINGFFTNIDWFRLASTVTIGISHFFEEITAFLEGMDIPSIFSKVMQFLTMIRYDEIFLSLTNYVLKIFEIMGQIFSDPTQILQVVLAFVKGLNAGIENIANNLDTITDSISSIVIAIFKAFTTFFGNVEWKELGNILASVIGGLKWDEFAVCMGEAAAALSNALIGFLEGLTQDPENWNNFVSGLSNSIVAVSENIDWARISKLLISLLDDDILNPILDLIGNVSGVLFDVVWRVLRKVLERISPLLVEAVKTLMQYLGGIVSQAFMEMMGWTDVKNWIGTQISGKGWSLSDLWSFGGNFLGGGNSGAFATGGFPEDGLFFANHGELVGKFTNGRTAVANNEQIVAGIERGVASAQSEQNQLLKQQNALLTKMLNKTSTVGVSTITQGLNRQNQRNGRVTVSVG